MRKLFFILLLISPSFWAQTAFEQGNQFYQKENYKAANSSFEGILASWK